MKKGRNPKPSKRGKRKGSSAAAMQGASTAGNLTLQLEHVSLLPLQALPSDPPSRFQKLLEAQACPDGLEQPFDADEGGEDKDCILSQDFFCTPDYITPDGPGLQIPNNFGADKENVPCPKSPEKSILARNKRHRQDSVSTNLPCHQQTTDLYLDAFGSDGPGDGKMSRTGSQKKQNYVSQSAVALRCRVMPPPCIKNPYLNIDSSIDFDIFGERRSKSTGFSPLVGGDGLSRYRTDFHEMDQIGCGNFSRVFKVLKRIDGCMYAVKHSIRQLHHDMERRRALMEVQALAALGSHENIVGYYSSWFENEQLYIQMELCDHSLSVNKHTSKSAEVLNVLYQYADLYFLKRHLEDFVNDHRFIGQVAKALQFMHEHGIAHLDVKPENIYVKNGVYKLGDFGCATLIDRSLRIEEGDSRYMPQEMFNDKYEHLDKVDIFSLGATTYELVKGSPLPDSGPQFSNLREGKIPLLPGYSMQFQSLLKAMMDPDPTRRPSAKQIMENSIFEKARGGAATK